MRKSLPTRLANTKIGLLCGLLSGAMWGLAFALPQLNLQYSVEAIVFGRFFFYAIASGLYLLWSARSNRGEKLSVRQVSVALFFGFIANSAFYILLVQSIRDVGLPAASLICGLIPLTVAITGVRSFKELRRTLLPIGLITAGIFALDRGAVSSVTSTAHAQIVHHELRRAAGYTSAFLALGLWSAFAILNSNYLKKYPRIVHGEWTSWIGIGALIFVIPLLILKGESRAMIEFFSSLTFSHWRFFISMMVLGFGSSWLANTLWNKASRLLPNSLLGQLIVSETLFALFYGFVSTRDSPRSWKLLLLG